MKIESDDFCGYFENNKCEYEEGGCNYQGKEDKTKCTYEVFWEYE